MGVGFRVRVEENGPIKSMVQAALNRVEFRGLGGRVWRF